MDLLNSTTEDWIQNEETYTDILKQASWKCFPLLNYCNMNNLKCGQLVRFRGMIQDMFNSEYYIDSCYSINEITGEKIQKYGKFRDFIEMKDNEIIEDESIVHKDVQTFHVISIPGENQWVIEMEQQRCTAVNVNIASSDVSRKRSLEDDLQMETEESLESSQAVNQSKRQCSDSAPQSLSRDDNISTYNFLNFPIENKSGKACLIKIYANESKLNLNDVCEFVGFISMDPRISQEYDSSQLSENFLEVQLHNPPSSLIPRIHCVALRKLQHGNPLVENIEINTSKFEQIRKDIILVLTQLLLGDEVAAEYILCHLISGVYVRRDLMALGKFSLNLSNIPIIEGFNYVEKLYEFIELFLTKSHYFPLTIQNVNDSTFIPKKDYDSNRLNSGILQLSANTVLVLDETKLTPGELGQQGVVAMKEIANVIRSQKVTYDFKYYPLEFDCDIPVLVASEGKSILPTDCHVVLHPQEGHVETFNEIIEAVKQYLKPELLNDIRKYLTLCRLVEYDLEETVHTIIHEKFVEMRRNKATAEDLHNLLVLNRLICVSYGKKTLDARSLDIVCGLEERRKQRLTK